MSQPTTSPSPEESLFLKQAEGWLQAKPFLLICILWANSAGLRDWELYHDSEQLKTRLTSLRSELVQVTAFLNARLTYYHTLTRLEANQMLADYQAGNEYILLFHTPPGTPSSSVFENYAGDSSADLEEDLNELIGKPVWYGPHPHGADLSEEDFLALPFWQSPAAMPGRHAW